jgi:DUF4097 and DUF4098 domain-containing protein YvlB
MRTETFTAPGPLRTTVRLTSGSVEIEAVEGSEAAVTVEPLNEPARRGLDELRIELIGDELVVDLERRIGGLTFMLRSPSFRVTIRVPRDSRLAVSTVSADLRARGRFAAAEVKTVSGDVSVEDVSEDATVKSVSGDIRFGSVGGAISANTVSGDVKVGEAARGAQIKTISGDQAVGSVSEGSAAFHSVSGDIRVGIRPGSGVWMDAKSTSGKTVSELETADGPPSDGPMVEVRAKAVSGDIRIVRAA